ncbi:MAG: hypothetical protein R3F61_14350 [Myxococcota bacterium]
MRFAALVLMVGCGTGGEVVDRLDLTGAFGPSDPEVTGVDVDADGALVFSTATEGLWRLDGSDAEQLLAPEDFWNAGLSDALTDVAVLGDGRIAMTVPGVGLVFDPADGSVVQHFCYEPGWGDWEIQRQETHSLAYDATTDRLLSQPQTLTDDSPERTDVAEFDRQTGEPLSWYTLDDRRFLASALTVTDAGVVLAKGASLYDYTLGDRTTEKRADLRGLGIHDIEGLAVQGDDLLVLDGDSNELVRVRGW